MPLTQATHLASEAALVLFSGGQDSASCLAWALDQFARVETIGFDYGQRHRIELECRERLLLRLRRSLGRLPPPMPAAPPSVVSPRWWLAGTRRRSRLSGSLLA